MGYVSSKWGHRAGDTVKLCNKGAHGLSDFTAAQALGLVSETRDLVDHLVAR